MLTKERLRLQQPNFFLVRGTVDLEESGGTSLQTAHRPAPACFVMRSHNIRVAFAIINESVWRSLSASTASSYASSSTNHEAGLHKEWSGKRLGTGRQKQGMEEQGKLFTMESS